MAVVVVLVVVGGLGGWLLTRGGSSAAAEPVTVKVTSGTITSSVTASGTIEPLDTADLDFAVSGTVTKVYVAEGAKVTKGQALAKVGNATLVAQRTAAYASLVAAKDQYTTDADASASAVQLASDQSNILSAQQSYDNAVTAVKDAVLRSTIDGTVTVVNLTKGDVAGSSSGGSSSGGSSLSSSSSSSSSSSTTSSAFEVVSSGSYVVSGTVAAADAASVKKGMEATITVTGVTKSIYGTVSSVGLVAQTSSGGAAVFPVTVKVTGKATGLYAGTSATAAITVKSVRNVLSVTSRAIQTDTGGSTYVEKVSGGKVVKTPIKTGTVYGATTQVLSGLKSGDTVQVPGLTLPSGSGGSTRRNGSTEGGFGGGFGGESGGGFSGEVPGGFSGGVPGGFGGGQ